MKQLGIWNARLPRIESQQIEGRPWNLFRPFCLTIVPVFPIGLLNEENGGGMQLQPSDKLLTESAAASI
jgi:hypothetical protein